MVKPWAQNLPAMMRKALSLKEAGRLREAYEHYRAILEARPDTVEALYQIGLIGMAIHSYDGAARALSKACDLRPDDLAILRACAEAHSEAGDTEAAAEAYRRLIRRMPEDMAPRLALGLLLQRAGDFKAAERELRRAIERVPQNGTLYLGLVSGKKLRPGDPLIAQMQALHRAHDLPARQHMHLCFALAKAMEDSGQTARVFPFLTEANAAMRAMMPHGTDPVSEREREIDGLIQLFEAADFSTPALEPDPGFAPIFVTGLARSGTTLVEQILASHSQVTGGGEVGLLSGALRKLVWPDVKGRPRAFAEIARGEFERVRGFYQDLLRRQFQFGTRFTDKTITSYLYIGLIKHILPSARIIVVDRDPRDTGLSSYKNLFREGDHRYAYDLESLAHHYAGYRKIMDFWRAKTPQAFTEVRYEDLIADPEGQSRRLIAAAGLEWEEGVLNFHANTRTVKTLAAHQVRQPIYASSVNAWKRYETELQPLIGALERYGVV